MDCCSSCTIPPHSTQHWEGLTYSPVYRPGHQSSWNVGNKWRRYRRVKKDWSDTKELWSVHTLKSIRYLAYNREIPWAHPASGMQTSNTIKIKGPFDKETLTPQSQKPNFIAHLSHRELGVKQPFYQPWDHHLPELQVLAYHHSAGHQPFL